MTHFQSRDAHARGGLTMLVAVCACVAATTPVMAHPFTIADDRGMLTASWKGEAGKIVDNAPTDADVAALAEVKDLERIAIGGCTAIRGTGFAALENLPKLRVIRLERTTREKSGFKAGLRPREKSGLERG
jgi:hypothetical protein